MTFQPIDQDRLFAQLSARENPPDPRLGRLRALHALGRTFELQIFIDAQPPRTVLFTKAPTLLDVAAAIGDLNLDDHVVSLRMTTHSFASSIPAFLDHARTPKIHQVVEPLVLTWEQMVNEGAHDAA
ncbi:hypothetical protein [Roseovarius sp. MBR-6]|jgi:hypothetical protein|uniref:hypothetical protein n=1 Tax=Roseovarius sp. MBR-6 TaxID=3156459 RepID=UPI00339A7F6E